MSINASTSDEDCKSSAPLDPGNIVKGDPLLDPFQFSGATLLVACQPRPMHRTGINMMHSVENFGTHMAKCRSSLTILIYNIFLQNLWSNGIYHSCPTF